MRCLIRPSLGVLLLLAGFAARADCPAPEHRQFDFWRGHWEVFTPDGQRAGENRIEPIAGGCALLERWTGRSGFTGASLNSYDATTKQWHQHWVDSSGSRLVLAGGWDGRRMVMESAGPADRITWTPSPDGSVRQHWQRSDDGGKTWKTVFDGLYKPLR